MWRCFHCDEVFFDEGKAAEHFGRSMLSEPACTIDVEKFREMEAELERWRNEDTDLHRRIAELEFKVGEHGRREEEKGYARGLRDAKRFPETLGLMRVQHAKPK